MQFIINHSYLLLAILLGVISQLIVKWKMSKYPFNENETIIDKVLLAFSMFLDPYIILSLTLTLLAGLMWMIAMTKFDISYAYPFTALSFVLIFILSFILFNEPISWQKIVGLGFIMIGIVVASQNV